MLPLTINAKLPCTFSIVKHSILYSEYLEYLFYSLPGKSFVLQAHTHCLCTLESCMYYESFKNGKYIFCIEILSNLWQTAKYKLKPIMKAPV